MIASFFFVSKKSPALIRITLLMKCIAREMHLSGSGHLSKRPGTNKAGCSSNQRVPQAPAGAQSQRLCYRGGFLPAGNCAILAGKNCRVPWC